MKKLIQRKYSIVFAFAIFMFLNFNNIYSTSVDTTHDLKLYSNNDILMDYNSGAILYNKAAYSKVYPASTTKIMTAILAIENLDLSSSIVASKHAIYSTPAGSSVVYLKPGEIMTAKNLLYCLLLNSGNDAANVLAEAVGTTIEKFVSMMNDKAKSIGCLNTHFANPHGFHDPNHYTTPYDMMKILQYALKNPTFREICETKTMVINETNMTNEKRYLKNTDKLLFTTSEDPNGLYYEYAVGGKTGYTIEARGTFVGYAKKGDSFILVGSFDGSQNISGQEARFLDAVTLFNYGFNNYTNRLIFDKNKIKFEVVDKVNRKKYTLGLKNDVYSLTDDTNYTINYSLNVNFDSLSKITKNIDIYNSETSNAVGNIAYQIQGVNWSLNNNEDLVVTNVSNYIDISYIISLSVKVVLISVALIILLLIITIFIKKNYSRTKILDIKKKKHKRITSIK